MAEGIKIGELAESTLRRKMYAPVQTEEGFTRKLDVGSLIADRTDLFYSHAVIKEKDGNLKVSHPNLGAEGVELVLMHYRNHERSHDRHVGEGYLISKGWHLASGQDNGDGTVDRFVFEGGRISLRELITYILQHYCTIEGYEGSMRSVTYEDYERARDSGRIVTFGRSLEHVKVARRFGIAARKVNPAFNPSPDRELVDTTTSVGGKDRWLYSPVTSFVVKIEKNGSIGIGDY